MRFSKMHGLGNSFVMMDDRRDEVSGGVDLRALAREACDPRFGIGADGLILVRASATADLAMRIINEDGSEAEMCGNGVRCLARFAAARGMTDRAELSIETPAGVIRTRLLGGVLVEVDMGEPRLRTADVCAPGPEPVAVDEQGLRFLFVSMGNPHAVTFVNDFDFDWKARGAAVERSPAFPNRTNVEFVRVAGPREAEVKVWERGCGETMACGTGACAVAVAGALSGRLERAPVTVCLPGGALTIHFTPQGRVLMTGPTVLVCEGDYFPGPGTGVA
ncbi:MAG: diaminopimelate epimerase [Deltaproteobacteria bacterium]|nr:diaminopimelate epimerase [Deltaproteobacteria bacterium]